METVDVETGEPITIRRQFGTTGKVTDSFVYRNVLALLEHELREWFTVNGKHHKVPHPVSP